MTHPVLVSISPESKRAGAPASARAGAPPRAGARPEDVLRRRAVDIDLGQVAGAHLAGRLSLVAVPGHGHAPVSSPSDIARAEAAVVAWGRRIGLADGIRDYLAKFCQSKLAALAGYTLPDVPVERARWFMFLQAFIFTIDDALDNLVDIRKADRYLPYERLADILGIFSDALSGEPLDPAREREAAAEFPLFDAFLAAVLTVREHAIDTGLDVEPFVKSMRDYFDALAWEHGAHADADYLPTLSTYVQNREQTISYVQSIESFLLIKGVALPSEIRERHPIKLLLANACRHVILVNDVFSLAKEIQCAELDNVLLLDGAPTALPKRFASLLRQIDALAADIAVIARRIDEAYDGDADVHAYVETIVNSVNGHIAWYCESHRYGRVVVGAEIETADAA